ncbi:hypothetical protein PISMIDRAFT_373441 [Pisolithus microcarpus 441]|uniref:Uncharacterized protein n=1 Tax=Pisolithus microcarpus 441 TaxID=765257 RepID=A0A0C9ZFM0_9AGAM|nr:hypothetical protein BKA83DRAFT_373441 [Pisolithus microcarpus]KIK24754.1 hypothetical protein PISMIDRAFT_373441 [Pisolithus microcarpus 441]
MMNPNSTNCEEATNHGCKRGSIAFLGLMDGWRGSVPTCFLSRFRSFSSFCEQGSPASPSFTQLPSRFCADSGVYYLFLFLSIIFVSSHLPCLVFHCATTITTPIALNRRWSRW